MSLARMRAATLGAPSSWFSQSNQEYKMNRFRSTAIGAILGIAVVGAGIGYAQTNAGTSPGSNTTPSGSPAATGESRTNPPTTPNTTANPSTPATPSTAPTPPAPATPSTDSTMNNSNSATPPASPTGSN